MSVWGCATAQRDYYQAPPAEPAGHKAALATQDLLPPTLTTLDREGLDFRPIVSIPPVLHGDLLREGEATGRILIVRHLPESPAEVAVEVRYGRFGNPSEEARLADLLAASLSVKTDTQAAPAPPAVDWTALDLSGRWVDLEAAVGRAGKTRSDVDYAVASVDRWRYATIFDLKMLDGAAGRLVVIGDRQDAAGPRRALLRIGRFGDAERESDLLRRTQAALKELNRLPRLPGAR